jgi:hypothetical protein
MAHNDECGDPECGCVAHRVRRARLWWEHVVHAVVHPIASTVVLVGAAYEVWEGFVHVLEHVAHWVHPAVTLVTGGGH